jgi:hypothetical protein
MGACGFRTTAIGRTPEEAYRNARDEADAQYGQQEGYSGRINVTRGFRLIVKPKGKQVKVFLRELEADENRLMDHPSEVYDKNLKRFVPNPKPKPARKYPGVFLPMVDSDKYGPCGCIEIGPAYRTVWDADQGKSVKKAIRGQRTYLFWGWAAE